MTELGRALQDLGGADLTLTLDELPVHSFVVDGDGIIRWQNQASRAGIGDSAGRRWTTRYPR